MSATWSESERAQSFLGFLNGSLQILNAAAQFFLSLESFVQSLAERCLPPVRQAVRDERRAVEVKLFDVEATRLGPTHKESIRAFLKVRSEFIPTCGGWRSAPLAAGR